MISKQNISIFSILKILNIFSIIGEYESKIQNVIELTDKMQYKVQFNPYRPRGFRPRKLIPYTEGLNTIRISR